MKRRTTAPLTDSEWAILKRWVDFAIKCRTDKKAVCPNKDDWDSMNKRPNEN